MENSPVGQEFLAMPEPHHHVSRLIILTIVLGVLAGAVWAYNYFISSNRVDQQTIVQDPFSDPSYNPPVQLTEEEIGVKKMQVEEENPPAKLTAQEIEAKKKSLQENN